MDIGYLGALLGGLLSLLSPCSVMLLPAFFAYAFSTPSKLIARTGVFFLGLLTTLVPLGVFAGTVGSFLTQRRELLLGIAAAVVIVFGLIQLAGIQVRGPRRKREGAATAWTVYLLGTVYGVAGVCTGPILGSVLMIAAVGANPVYGAMLLAVYAAGMTLPLLVLALVWGRWSGRVRAALTPRMLTIGRWSNSWHAVVSGLLSVILGVLLIVVARDPEAGLLPIAVQYRLETGAARLGAGTSNLVVLAVGVALAGLVWLLARRRPAPDGVPSDPDGVPPEGAGLADAGDAVAAGAALTRGPAVDLRAARREAP